MEEPILKYSNQKKPCALFIDVSKYLWTCVLTQAYEHVMGVKYKIIQHHITYQSGLLRGSQMNWAALPKQAYDIYMSVRNVTYCLEDTYITLKRDPYLL